MNQHRAGFDLYYFLSLIKKHFFMVLLIPVACGAVGFSVAMWLIPPQYESNVVLTVKSAQSQQTAGITNDQVSAVYAILFKSDTALKEATKNFSFNIQQQNNRQFMLLLPACD